MRIAYPIIILFIALIISAGTALQVRMMNQQLDDLQQKITIMEGKVNECR